MPRKKIREKRRSKQQVNIKERKPWAMDYAPFLESDIQKLSDYRVSPAAWSVFFYFAANQNLATGIGHRIKYQEIADYYGYTVPTIMEAVLELERIGLLNFRETGDVIVQIPSYAMHNQRQHIRVREADRQKFFEAWQKRIEDAEFENKRKTNSSHKLRLYDELVSEWNRQRPYQPTDKQRMSALDELAERTGAPE